MEGEPTLSTDEIDFGLDLRPAAPVLPGGEFHREMARLREAHRLADVRFGSGRALLVTRFDDLDAAFRDDEGLPAGPTYKMAIEPCQGVTFESLDGPEHHTLRDLTTRELRSRPVARFAEDRLPEIAHGVIDRFADSGSADLVAEFTSVFPFLVFAHRMGLPLDDADKFYDWAFDILSYPIANEPGLAAAAELTDYTVASLADRRKCPVDDLLSSMTTAEKAGRRLTDEEILAHVRALFSAGATTSFHGLGNTLYAVLAHPESLGALTGDPSLIPAAVDEMLRWEPPLGVLTRIVPFDAEVAGERVPAMTLLLFGIASANRDPAIYQNPDRFDIHRRPGRLLTFGFGSHYCPGSHLAKAQIAVGLQALLERLPDLRFAGGGRGDAAEVAARPSGTVMRGPRELRVTWSPHSP